MFPHMRLHAVDVLKILHMAELIELIRANRLNGHDTLDGIQICPRCRNCRNTGAGEGHFGGGAKFIYQIFVSVSGTFCKNL